MLFMFFEVIFCFYDWYFVHSWKKKISVLHWNWITLCVIPVFGTGLSFKINHEHDIVVSHVLNVLTGAWGRWNCYHDTSRVLTNALDTRQAMYLQRNVEARSCSHCCSGKAISVKYSERVFVALGIQYDMRMRHIVICGRPALQYFLTLSHKRQDFGKKVLSIKCVFCFSLQLLS